MSQEKAIVTCALTGVLTDPKQHPVPVTVDEMAAAAKQAYDAGATVVHLHIRDQRPGKGALPSWDPKIAKKICDAIREKVPGIVINLSTGVVGSDISGPVSCLESTQPEMAALNAGSLNYLKAKKNGEWAWPPFLFDNAVEKVERFLECMQSFDIIPEFECFDTGIIRSVQLYKQVGLYRGNFHLSFVMGVSSGMPAKPEWLPLLLNEISPEDHWQVIAIGREDVWPLHRKCIQLGGNVRTGLEDTFYLDGGEKATSNGALIECLVKMIREEGREVSSLEDTRKALGLESVKNG